MDILGGITDMVERVLNSQHLYAFRENLICEEKSVATIEKYCRDVRQFFVYAGEQSVTKALSIAYKQSLVEQGYAVSSINSMLTSLNSLFDFLDWTDCKVKTLRRQRQIYCAEEKELSKSEYLRLLKASEKQVQLNLVLQTICATGIRISELKYFTMEALRQGEVTVRCKNKTRTILVPGKLKNRLFNYAKSRHITSGPVFCTRSGMPLDRSNLWAQMKKLCAAAGVNPTKVFPHNLRKLFARTFYAIEKDIAKLADILGHSSIETTRIYIMTTGQEHRRKIEKLGLLL